MVGSTAVGHDADGAVPARQRVDGRRAQRGRAPGLRVARGVPAPRAAPRRPPRAPGRPGCRPRGRRARRGAPARWPSRRRGCPTGSRPPRGTRPRRPGAAARGASLALRREGGHGAHVAVELADLRGAAGRAELVEEVDVGLGVAPTTAPGRRPRSRWPPPGTPARTPRSRRTRRGGCTSSGPLRRCSRPGTPRCRPCRARPHTVRRSRTSRRLLILALVLAAPGGAQPDRGGSGEYSRPRRAAPVRGAPELLRGAVVGATQGTLTAPQRGVRATHSAAARAARLSPERSLR